jgi:glutathione synthase/RimK-type ligase-like ATP-grasp enzyme
MIRLLCIANPERYAGAVTDVPLSYARLAAHPEVELYHADTAAMMRGGDLIETVPVPVGFMPDQLRSLSQRPTEPRPPEAFDLAFDRTLKPFPEGFVEALGGWSSRLRFVNDPAGIARQLDPAFLIRAARGHLPPVLLTGDAGEAEAFFRRHGTVVAKRPNSCGGREVYRIGFAADGSLRSDNIGEGERIHADFAALFARLSAEGAESVLLARFLPRVTEGDRRIVVVGGEIYGTYVRSSTDGHWVQNVSRGGRCELLDVTGEDRRLVEATCRPYREVGVNVLGYDLLRDDDDRWLISEINAGNVGGLFRLEYLGVAGITDRFVDWLHRLAETSGPPAGGRPGLTVTGGAVKRDGAVLRP